MSIVERHLPYGGGSQTPKRIVIHCMAENVVLEGKQFSAWELLDHLKLSAHVLISPDGSRTRCRADTEVAWHAKGFNTDSLGVEVLVPDVFNLDQLQQRTKTTWVSQEQMASLAQQIMIWKKAWPIERIDRHSDLDPARRWYDPGEGFPWEELLRQTWT